MKIVIIDDNYQYALQLSCILEYKEHEVEVICDADEIIENISLIEKFDIAILDLSFTPLKNNTYNLEFVGIEILKCIRKISDIPVIMCSAFVYSLVKDRISPYANVSYLEKPVRTKDFIDLLNVIKK